MPIDDGIMAKIRRNGYAGDAAKATQDLEDVKARGYSDMDIRRSNYENMSADKLHQIADDSHQDHKEATGQMPNQETEPYYQPGSDD